MVKNLLFISSTLIQSCTKQKDLPFYQNVVLKKDKFLKIYIILGTLILTGKVRNVQFGCNDDMLVFCRSSNDQQPMIYSSSIQINMSRTVSKLFHCKRVPLFFHEYSPLQNERIRETKIACRYQIVEFLLISSSFT